MTTSNKKPVNVLVTANKFITGQKEIESAIDKAVKAGNTVQQSFQIIACSALKHTAEHGDIRVIRKLLDSLPEAMRKVAMSTFIDKFGTVRFDEEGQAYYDKGKKLDLAGAVRTAWWKTAKEATYAPFVTVNELEKVYERAVKRFEKQDATKGDDIKATDLRAIRDLIDSLNGKPARKQVKKAA